MAKREGVVIEGQAEEVSPEQAADLAVLMAAAGEGGGPRVEAEPEPEQPAVSSEEALAGLLTVAGMTAGMIGYKRAAAIWSHESCRGLADRAVPVLRKYAWGSRFLNFLDTGAGVEEIALAMYAAPMVLATVAAAREDAAEMRPAKPDDEGQKGQEVPPRPPSAGEMREVHEVGA